MTLDKSMLRILLSVLCNKQNNRECLKLKNNSNMKTKNLFGILMLFLSTFTLISCDKEDEKMQQFEFTPESLSQTVWKGNITDPNYNGEIGLNFETKKKGKVSCVYPQDPQYHITDNFTYNIDGKYIYFDGSTILGDNVPWVLIELTDNKMLLKCNPEYINPQNQSTLELKRIY